MTSPAVSTGPPTIPSGGVTWSPGSTPRRRGQTKGDRRERAILDSARALLEHKRLSAVSTDELASGAGISRSSLYFYFDSKTAVLTALLDELSTGLRDENSPWLESVGPSEAALRAAAVHTVGLWETAGGLLRQAFTGDDEQLAAWRDGVVERGITRTAAKIERDRAAGLAPPGPPSPAALARMVHGARTELLLHHRDQLDRTAPGSPGRRAATAETVDALVALVLRLAYRP